MNCFPFSILIFFFGVKGCLSPLLLATKQTYSFHQPPKHAQQRGKAERSRKVPYSKEENDLYMLDTDKEEASYCERFILTQFN